MSPRLRFGLLLWCAGMIGVLAMTALALPQMLAGTALPMPMWTLILVSLVQSGVLLTLAVLGGLAFSTAVGLRAPLFEAIASRAHALGVLRAQAGMGLIAG